MAPCDIIDFSSGCSTTASSIYSARAMTASDLRHAQEMLNRQRNMECEMERQRLKWRVEPMAYPRGYLDKYGQFANEYECQYNEPKRKPISAAKAQLLKYRLKYLEMKSPAVKEWMNYHNFSGRDIESMYEEAKAIAANNLN